jgi:hypothetical protein
MFLLKRIWRVLSRKKSRRSRSFFLSIRGEAKSSADCLSASAPFFRAFPRAFSSLFSLAYPSLARRLFFPSPLQARGKAREGAGGAPPFGAGRQKFPPRPPAKREGNCPASRPNFLKNNSKSPSFKALRFPPRNLARLRARTRSPPSSRFYPRTRTKQWHSHCNKALRIHGAPLARDAPLGAPPRPAARKGPLISA